MERFTNAEIADMYLMYGMVEGNALRGTRLYLDRFLDREMPGHQLFTNLHRRIRDTSNFRVNVVHLGHPSHCRKRMIDHFENHSRTSTRAADQHLGLSLHNNRIHPFHFQRMRQLLPRDFGPRVQFTECFFA